VKEGKMAVFFLTTIIVLTVLTALVILYYLYRGRRITRLNQQAFECIGYHCWDDAIRYLQKALTIDRDNSLTNYNLGFALYFGKNLPALAHGKFAAAIASDHRMASAHYAMGHLLFHVYHDTASARKHLETALQINPMLAEAHNTMGLIDIADKNWTAATECFVRAVSINESYDTAWCNASIAYVNTGRVNKALEAAVKYTHLLPNNAEAFSNLGNIYGAAGRKEHAQNAFEKAISIDPSNWLNHFWLGCVCLQNKNYFQAIHSFNEANRIHGESALTHYNLALSYEAIKLPVPARTHIDRALELDPSMGKNLA
jgi:tetratricopeptide (TPR) repeat protein